MERTTIVIYSFIYGLLGPKRYSSPKGRLRLNFATNSCFYQYSQCFQRYAVIIAESPHPPAGGEE